MISEAGKVDKRLHPGSEGPSQETLVVLVELGAPKERSPEAPSIIPESIS